MKGSIEEKLSLMKREGRCLSPSSIVGADFQHTYLGAGGPSDGAAWGKPKMLLMYNKNKYAEVLVVSF